MKNNKTNHNKKILIKIASTIFTCYFLMITILPYKANNIYAIDETKYEDNSYNNALYILSILNQNGIYLNFANVNETDYKTIYNYLVSTGTYATYLTTQNNNSLKSLILTTLEIGITELTKNIVSIDTETITNFYNNCYGVDWLAKQIEIFCEEKQIDQTTFKIYVSNYTLKTDSNGINYVNEFLQWLASKYNLIDEGSSIINIKEGTSTNFVYFGGRINESTSTYTIHKNESGIVSLDLTNNKYYIYGYPSYVSSWGKSDPEKVDEFVSYKTLDFQIKSDTELNITINNQYNSNPPYYSEILNQEIKINSNGYYTINEDTTNLNKVIRIKLSNTTYTDNTNGEIGSHQIKNSINILSGEIKEENNINLQWNNLFGNYLQLITENQFLQMDYMEILSDENLMNYEKLTDIEKLLNDLLYVQMSNQTYNYNSSSGTTYNYFNTYIFDSSDNSVVNNSKYFITNKNTEIKNEYNTYNDIENNYIQELENLFNDLDLENNEKFNLTEDTLTATNEFKNLIEYTYNKMTENGMGSLIGIPLILSIIGMIIK